MTNKDLPRFYTNNDAEGDANGFVRRNQNGEIPGGGSSNIHLENGEGENSVQQKRSSRDVEFVNPYVELPEGFEYKIGAFGKDSFEANGNSMAYGELSFAEGRNSLAYGARSHAEGTKTATMATNAHAEGLQTVASGYQAHSEGKETLASGTYITNGMVYQVESIIASSANMITIEMYKITDGTEFTVETGAIDVIDTQL